MWKRLSVVWSLVKGDAKLAPAWLKWGTVAVVLYLVSPVDFIPDLIPVLGVMDDMVLVPLAIRWLLKRLPETIRRDIERRASGKFGTEITDVAEAVNPR